MENLGNNIANNLIYLRKKASLTQLEFGEKINYSDKTISKWELGTVIPSVETLKEIADFYGVSLDYLVSEHRSQKDYATSITKTINAKNRITLIALAVTALFCIAVVVFIAGYLNIGTVSGDVNRYWLSFVWFLPASFFIMGFLVYRYFRGSKWIMIFYSCALWTLLLSSYITFIDKDNYWFLFIIGVPVQIGLIFINNLSKPK